MDKSIRIRILNREYPLRVRADDEARMRRIAEAVDERLTAFKQTHPEQPDLVAAVMVALAFAEEAAGVRAHLRAELSAELDALDAELAASLGGDG
ncbi:MAG: cell division protein ZapA [Rhodothermales bacterium]|nr:cell division protein ZapA [Rhodothermales bacterium]